MGILGIFRNRVKKGGNMNLDEQIGNSYNRIDNLQHEIYQFDLSKADFEDVNRLKKLSAQLIEESKKYQSLKIIKGMLG